MEYEHKNQDVEFPATDAYIPESSSYISGDDDRANSIQPDNIEHTISHPRPLPDLEYLLKTGLVRPYDEQQPKPESNR